MKNLEDFVIPKIASTGKKYCKYCRRILSETEEEFHQECNKEVDNHGLEYPSDKDLIILNDLHQFIFGSTISLQPGVRHGFGIYLLKDLQGLHRLQYRIALSILP